MEYHGEARKNYLAKIKRVRKNKNNSKRKRAKRVIKSIRKNNLFIRKI